MRHHKNKHMLMSILQKVQSSGQTIRIFKVKAHTGVLGNEYADEAAKRATELLADDRTCQQPVACAADAAPPYTDMYWPVIASSSQLQDDDAHGKRGPVWLNDINGALKRHLHPHSHKGQIAETAPTLPMPARLPGDHLEASD
jgi:hypothetical protein